MSSKKDIIVSSITPEAIKKRNQRSRESIEQRTKRLALQRQRQARLRKNETNEKRAERLKKMRENASKRVAVEGEPGKPTSNRLLLERERTAQTEQITLRGDKHNLSKQFMSIEEWHLSGFSYIEGHDYASETTARIKSFRHACPECGGKRWRSEYPGMCCSGRKVKQFARNMYAKMESEKLRHIRATQAQLWAPSYTVSQDALDHDVLDGYNIGQKTILPSTFPGSPRYYHERIQDAMTYVRVYGNPDLLITFECNPNWSEIQNELEPEETYVNRHDIIARVFRLKLVKMMALITKGRIFGTVRCHIYTIEWQNSELPQARVLIWLIKKLDKNEIDQIISAELPDPTKDKDLYELVKAHMVHGPCSALNPNSSCMNKHGKCMKKYPRDFIEVTTVEEDGYPTYRRRKPESGLFEAKIRRYKIDNSWIVPYSPLLLKTLNAHANVDFCHSARSIKYVCTYVNKDENKFNIQQETKRRLDEIQEFQDSRNISINEAFWRIFDFSLQERYPPIQKLAVHLENGERESSTELALEPKETTLTAFFRLCAEDSFARSLFYHQVPSYYIFANGNWSRRVEELPLEDEQEIKFDDTLGRVCTVHPVQVECFFLRILLHEVRGPTSFESLRSVNNEICPSYKEACRKRRLLGDDAQWDAAIDEARVLCSSRSLRSLFVVILEGRQIEVSDAKRFWMKYRDDLSEDFYHREMVRWAGHDVLYNNRIYNQALIAIENGTLAIGGKTLIEHGLPDPIRESPVGFSEILRETSYDINTLSSYINENEQKLSSEQKIVYDTILDRVQCNNGGILFLDAPSGAGKTFVLNLVLRKVRHESGIALAMASSEMAASHLPGGRTVHSTFEHILQEFSNKKSVCYIDKHSEVTKVFQKCNLIVWDECTNTHKNDLEAVDRFLRDVRGNNSPMGGIVLILSGDFRQALPVVPKGTVAQEIEACLKSSYIWDFTHTLMWTSNMRAQLHEENSSFPEDLKALGEGKVLPDENGEISISHICTTVHSEDELMEKVYPNIAEHYEDVVYDDYQELGQWLSERAILAPKNARVDSINLEMLKKIPGSCHTYKSIDTVLDKSDMVTYPMEFLNSLSPPSVAEHKLDLKEGVPIMLLRNLNPPNLCNGTRLLVKKALTHVLEATILTGFGRGQDVFIPRIPIIASEVPFRFKRLQFPIRLCFAVPIHKLGGQTLSICGLHLQEPCFAHGQLYSGCSRVGSSKNLFIFAPGDKTKNIVYQEVV